MKKIALFEYDGVFFTNVKKYESAEAGLKDLIGNEVCVLPINSNNSEINENYKVLEVKDGLGNVYDLDIFARLCSVSKRGFNEGVIINEEYACITNADELAKRYSYDFYGLKIHYKSFDEVYYSDNEGTPFLTLIHNMKNLSNDEVNDLINKFEEENEISFDNDYAYGTEWELDEDDFYTSHGINIQL